MIDDDAPFEASGRNLAILFGSVLIGTLANAAGVGGGAIYVPMFNIFIGFALKSSIALSQAVIMTGSMVSVALNMTKTHAHAPTTPLINYEVALVISPILFVGVSMGVLLNVVLPSWLITLILLLLLTLLGAHAVIKGVVLWQQESRAFAHALLPRSLSQRSRSLHTAGASMRQPSAFALAAMSRDARSGRTPVSLPTQFPGNSLFLGSPIAQTNSLQPSGSTPAPLTSLSKRFSKSFRQLAESRSLGFFLENLEGLDFSVHHTASRFAVSSRGAESEEDPFDLTGVSIDEGHPEQEDEEACDDNNSQHGIHGGRLDPNNRDRDSGSSQNEINGNSDEEEVGQPSGISPRHSHIAGPADPGRARLTAAPGTSSDAPDLDVELALGVLPQAPHKRPLGYPLLGAAQPKLELSPTRSRDRQAGVVPRPPRLPSLQLPRQAPPPAAAAAVSAAKPTPAAGLGRHLPDYSHVPWGCVGQLFAVWLLYVGLQLGRSYAGGCTALGWGLYAAQLVSMLLLAVLLTLRCRHEGRTKPLFKIPTHFPKRIVSLSSSSNAVKSLSQSSDKEFMVYSLVVFFSGITTGLLGTGTGTVLGPLLLEMGLTPQVTLRSSSGAAGMVSAVLAFTTVASLLRHVQRASIIVIALASVIVTGALLVYIFGLKAAVEDLRFHNWAWGNVCSND
ncbi:MAG: hypothetical protein WDW36_002402 [Sanguina aurantia]